MSDIKKLLETMDQMSAAERKPTGPKFPGYWKGTDPASKAKDKMVGGAEESIIKDLHSTAKERVTEWQLQEKYARFKEQDSKAYTGIDPIVRQRMGMPPATADEIKSYVNKNPPGIKAGDSYLTTNTGVGLDPDKPVVPQAVISGGQMDVIRAAARAVGIDPDKNVDLTEPPVRPAASQGQPPVSTVVPAASTTSSSGGSSGSNLPGMFNPGLPNWQNSPLNPANRRDSSSAPAVAPFGSGSPDTRLLINPPQGSAALNPAKNTDSATNIPGGQSAGGPGVVPPAARPSSTSTPYRGNQGAREIQAVNPSIKDVNKIQAGQRLKLPDSDEDYVVQKGDTLDKIGKMYRSGEIGGRVISTTQGGEPIPPQTPPAPAAIPQPAARPQPAAPRSPAGQTSKGPEVSKSSDAMASYATKGGRVYAADFNNPGGIGWDGKGKYTSYKTPEEGVNATKDLVARYLTDQTPFIKGSPTPDQVVSTWVSGGKTPADKIQGGRYLQSVKDELAAAGVKLDAKGRIPYSQAARDAITRAIVRHETAPKHMEKFAPFLNAPKDAKGAVEESNKEDEKIAGRYDPDDFDLMVKRLGQRAREQDRKHGPVDIAALAKRLRELEKRHQTNEVEDPAVNMQDPDVQRTSQTSPQQDPAAVKQQQLDQTVDMATAKGTMAGLKNVLGPKVDTNALASAVTKISDGKPLSGPESMSMSALTPLISKAAETPQTAMALKTALSNAGMLAKQGK